MSAHGRRQRLLTIREAAKRDIDHVRVSTRQRWGVDQRRRYRVRLNHALLKLLDFPELGPRRDNLFVGCRNLVVGNHVVFYQVIGDEIVVGRVLHTSQDPTSKVTP